MTGLSIIRGLCISLALALLLSFLPGCRDSVSERSKKYVTLTGSLTREEILSRIEDGSLIGLSRKELISLCGDPQETDKYPNYSYKVVIGICDGYAPDYQWLLANIESDHVVAVALDCD